MIDQRALVNRGDQWLRFVCAGALLYPMGTPGPLRGNRGKEYRGWRSAIEARETYHHGDLKAAALDAALRAVEGEKGKVPSMRALAQDLGVGHRALYNHYADREALLATIAAEGFKRLASVLRAADNEHSHLRAYVDFALENPELYSVMMERPYRSFHENEALSVAVDEVIAASLETLAPADDNPDRRRRRVMRVWMLAHGGIALHRAGALKTRSDESFAEEFMLIAFP